MADSNKHGDVSDGHVKRYLDHNPETVAILGMGPSCQDFLTETLTQEFLPDFADEVWAINMASNCFHHDVVFWMDDLDAQDAFKPGLFSCLRRRGKPVITTKSTPHIVPNSFDYPIDEIGAMSLGIFGKPYLNNGVAMALAYALWKDVKCIKMYGCDFSYPNRDYAESGRACVEAWITVACLSKNTHVQLCERTSLFDAVDNKGIYGYREQPDIHLPDGKIYRCKERKIIDPNEYTPEDSSGVPQKEMTNGGSVQSPVPGANGAGAPDAGPAPTAEHAPETASPPATP